jgi:hypothetical protein
VIGTLLIGAVGAAEAVPGVILDGDNVVRIENLPALDQFGNETLYNVDFVVTTPADLYGPSLDLELVDEDAALGLEAVLDALNSNDPTPLGAGPLGSNLFLIGAKDEDLGFVGAVGGEIFAGVWDQCAPFNCIAGVAIVSEDETGTFARFTVVPEPGTALLLGLGLAGLTRRHRP